MIFSEPVTARLFRWDDLEPSKRTMFCARFKEDRFLGVGDLFLPLSVFTFFHIHGFRGSYPVTGHTGYVLESVEGEHAYIRAYMANDESIAYGGIA